MDLPLFAVPSLPFGTSLELDDQLFGDEFLNLLTSDLAMDCDPGMSLVPLELDTSPATSSHLSDNTHPLAPCAPPSPASQPQSSCGESERPILLPAMAVSRGPKAKNATVFASASGLPSLASGGIARAWTVTTDVNLQSATPAEQPAPSMPAWDAPSNLRTKPSGDGSTFQAPRTRRRGPAKPAVQPSEDLDDDTDSEDSNDTQDEEMVSETKCGNKRKAPDVDWRSIADPAERRRQRRLAKNRVTAARSRERKKSQWAVMEAAQQKLEAENRALRDALNAATQDNQSLRAQLEAALGCGLGADATQPGATAAAGRLRGTSHTEPAVLVLIATLLTVWLALPSDQAAVVTGAAMAALLLLKRLQSTKSSSRNWSGAPGASDSAMVKTEKLQREGQQQAAALAGHKAGARARASMKKPLAKGVVVKHEEPDQDVKIGIVETGDLALWAASAVCVLRKVGKASCHGLPKGRVGKVPVGLFVS